MKCQPTTQTPGASQNFGTHRGLGGYPPKIPPEIWDAPPNASEQNRASRLASLVTLVVGGLLLLGLGFYLGQQHLTGVDCQSYVAGMAQYLDEPEKLQSFVTSFTRALLSRWEII